MATEKMIAETVEKLMEEKGYTVASFAEATGLPYNTLKRRIQTGRNLRIDELSMIADALGMEFTELMEAAGAKLAA